MKRLKSNRGDVLLPILTVLFMFGLFWIAYVRWCRHVYWSMRMDMAADATALSAAREQAALLNTIATYQYLENLQMQKMGFFGNDVAHLQAASANLFFAYNAGLQVAVRSYVPNTYRVAQMVAKANGATEFPVPLPPPQHHLKPKNVHVVIFAGLYPVAKKDVRAAYYARDWWPKKTAPQPVHRNTWVVCREGKCAKGKAQLWLDVRPGNILNNGGFPSDQPSLVRGIGIQSHFPQFNARLMPKFFNE